MPPAAAFPPSPRPPAARAGEAPAARAAPPGVDADEIVIGPNMTTLTFHLSRSIGAGLEPGDEIVLTGLDHAANVDPWLAVAADRGLIVRGGEPGLAGCPLDL